MTSERRRAGARFRARDSIRARTVRGALVVFAGSLLLTSVALVIIVQDAQRSSIDSTLRVQADAVAALLRSGRPPNVVPVATNEASFVQVINARGRVVTASPGLEGQGPIARAAAHPGVNYQTLSTLPIGNGDPFRVLTLRVITPRGPETIFVGYALSLVDATLRNLTFGLIVLDTLLIVLVGLLSWWFVGRALAPVEVLRREVHEITASNLARRVAEPARRDEIGRLAVTMNEMLDRLDRADRRQRRFVADASHELRSPLTAAQSELEVSLIHGSANEWAASARLVVSDLERVRRIVDDLVLLAQYDEGDSTSRHQPVDLDEIIVEECQRLRRTSDRQIDYSAVSGARVSGEREALRRVVRNLLDNAARHATGLVTISLHAHEGEVEMRVRDDGPGIAPEDRERIFERFTRLDDARARDAGGSGLGLAIVADAVRAHGGEVELTDVEVGTEFVVRLARLE